MSSPSSRLPYESSHEVRFRDLDPLGHVNNVVYATYCEQCRVRFFEDVEVRDGDVDIVVAHLELDFRRPIDSIGTVTVTMEAAEVGESSFEFAYELVFEGEVVATGSSVQVAVDGSTGETVPLPEEWRAVLTDRGDA